MAEPILINRYASRRLYNTTTSEYVTLDEISELIRKGNDVVIKDRKSGEDLTRQFLLQIITEQESKGENVLPVNVLTGLVRSYSTAAQGMLPDFLSQSYEVFSQQQASMLEQISKGSGMNMGAAGGWQKQQAEMMQNLMSAWMPQMQKTTPAEPAKDDAAEELATVKQQLAELMKRLMGSKDYKMKLNVYLAGEIHTNWRDEIIAECHANDLDITFTAPVTDHGASDDCGVEILGAEPQKFWHDNKGANLNAIRTRKAIKDADVVVVRFGEKYKQWNAAFDAWYASALGKSLIVLQMDEHQHALKEVDAAAQVVCSTPLQVAQALTYVLNSTLP